MKTKIYEVRQLADGCFKFISEGQKGSFEMRILITRDFTNTKHALYNLAFGVWNSTTNDIDDAIEVRNGDMDQILATVGSAALMFLEDHPEGFIYAEGSTMARTRKYQMGIAKHLADIPERFQIKGLLMESGSGNKNRSATWEHMRSGVNYSAFLMFVK